MYRTLAVSGYRSLRDLAVRLGRVTVVTGANGVGKSNLYRAIRLLSECASGNVIGSLAREGGLASVLWAGPETLRAARETGQAQPLVPSGPVSLKLGVGADGFSYLIDLGLPATPGSAFVRDPELRREAIWAGPVLRPSTLIAERRNGAAKFRDDDAPWHRLPYPLAPHTSLLSEVPQVRPLRDELAGWRFYDALRTDSTAPARQPQVGTRTWALASDGSDLAAALQTILEYDARSLTQHFVDAFPRSEVLVTENDGIFDVMIQQPGLLRPLRSSELSDGTLRYLMLLAALLAPRRPTLMALNEPENSLHPSLVEPLARLIAAAATQNTQVVVVTHSKALTQALSTAVPEDDIEFIELEKDTGETIAAGQTLLSKPQWEWGKR